MENTFELIIKARIRGIKARTNVNRKSWVSSVIQTASDNEVSAALLAAASVDILLASIV